MIVSPSSRFSQQFTENQLLYMAAAVYTLGSTSGLLLSIFISVITNKVIPLSFLIALGLLIIVIPSLFIGRVWIHKKWGLVGGLHFQYYLDLTWLLIAFITSLPGIPFRFIATGFLIGMRGGFLDEGSEIEARLAVVTCLLLLVVPMLSLLAYLFLYLAGVHGFILEGVFIYTREVTLSSLFLLVFILIPIRFLEGRRIYDWNQGLFFLLVAFTVLWLIFSPFGYIPVLSLPGGA